MGRRENNVTKRVNAAFCKLKARLFRINLGHGWTGDKIIRGPGYIKIINPRPFKNTLPSGFPDTLGFTMVKITPEMVGKELPVFTMVEVKTGDGTVRKNQREQIEIGKGFNCIAGVARCEDDAEKIINEYNPK